MVEFQRAVDLDHPLQVLAVDEFHDDEIAVHFIVDAIGLNDIGMIECGDRPGLGEEAIERGPILGDRAGDDFQGHAAIHRHVLGEEDGAHAAFAQPLNELVLSQAELCPLAQGQERAGLPAADEIFAGQGPGQGWHRTTDRRDAEPRRTAPSRAACFFPAPTDNWSTVLTAMISLCPFRWGFLAA